MSDQRTSLDESYMRMAEVWALRSYATRAKVGAMMVKDRQIISDGYNGMPGGFLNSQVEIHENGQVRTNPLVLHAESNAILKCAKNGVSSKGSTLYVTMSPCTECVKLITQSGIRRVVYRNQYRDISPLEILEQAGIEVLHLPPESDVPVVVSSPTIYGKILAFFNRIVNFFNRRFAEKGAKK